MSILPPTATGGTPAQASDQSPVSFNDSLLTASKMYSEAGDLTTIGTKTERQSDPASQDAKTSSAVPDIRSIQSPVASQMAVLQQAALPAQQAQLTSTAVSPTELSFSEAGTFSDVPNTVVGQPFLNSEAGWTAGTESTIAQSSVVMPAGNLSKYSQLGITPSPKGPLSSGSTTQKIKSLPVAPSATRSSVSVGGATSPALLDRGLIQNLVQSPAPKEVVDSLPQSALNAVPSVAASAFSNVESNTIPIPVADARSNATSDRIPSPVLSGAAEEQANSLPQSGLYAVADAAPGTSPNAAPDKVPIAVSGVQSNAASSEIQNLKLNEAPGEAANLLLQSALDVVADAAQNVSSNANLNTVQAATSGVQSNRLTSSIQSPTPTELPAEEQNSLPQSVPNAPASVASIASSSAVSNTVPVTSATATSTELQSSFLKTVLKAFAGVIPNGLTNATPNAAEHVMANNSQNPELSAVPNAAASTVHTEAQNAASNSASTAPMIADPVSSPHTAQSTSPKENVAPGSNSASASRTIAPQASPDQTIPASGPSVSQTTVDQIAAQNQFTAGALVASQAGLSGLNSTSVTKLSSISSNNGKIGSTDATDDATGLKEHTPSTSNFATSQTSSQQTTTSADQNQVSAPSQAQGASAPQINLAGHAVVDGTHSQTATVTSPVQATPAPGGNAGHAANTPDRTAPAATAAPQTSPVINTAKLIQSVGQSEMRVGMRSNEFGNISINTSSTRDSISAQISLDHGELAKTLTAHLPEFQARLSSNQSVDVRIDTTSTRSGLGAGTSGGFSDGANSDSRGSRQQAESASSGYSGNGFTEGQFSPAASTATTNDSGLNARLDIRI